MIWWSNFTWYESPLHIPYINNKCAVGDKFMQKLVCAASLQLIEQNLYERPNLVRDKEGELENDVECGGCGGGGGSNALKAQHWSLSDRSLMREKFQQRFDFDVYVCRCATYPLGNFISLTVVEWSPAKRCHHRLCMSILTETSICRYKHSTKAFPQLRLAR